MASKVFWITRDNWKGSTYEVWPYRDHPKNDNGEYATDDGDGGSFQCCCGEFKSLTGITLKPGQKKKFRLVVQK